MSTMHPLDFFKELTKFPRDTGDEKAVSDYLVAFARERGLRAVQDEAYNVIIYKPGTSGYENAPTVILQGHLDMVYIKGETCPHDYNSPLELIEEEGYLRANDTSLGADNGLGCAYAMALLDSTTIPHPPLECLFTTGEEVGMVGVEALSADLISGRRLINLDSEEEGVFTVGCAGGLRMSLSLEAGWEAVPAGKTACSIRIHDLLGGHSGIEINRGRGNANRLLGRVLQAISSRIPVGVATLGGGSKMNAIPDRSEAVIVIDSADTGKLAEVIACCRSTFQNELSGADPNVTITMEAADCPARIMTADALNKVILLLTTIPIGVQSMSAHLPGLVESSNNLGIVTCEDGAVNFFCAIRSSVGSLKSFICTQITLLAETAGASVKQDNAYPEWPYLPQSALRDLCVDVYKKMYNSEPEVGAIHAGLECGYFMEMWPDMDIVSIGPNITGAHTPQETLDIASANRVWEYLLELLAAIK